MAFTRLPQVMLLTAVLVDGVLIDKSGLIAGTNFTGDARQPHLKEMAEKGMKWLTRGFHHASEALAPAQHRDDEVDIESTRRRKVPGSSDLTTGAWNDMGLGPDENTAPVLGSDFGEDYVNWSLCGASFHSNLADVGPDLGEQSVRYYNVATAGGGQGIDLVVTANTSYSARDININGLVSGDSCFGVVNLKSSGSGHNSVDLLFSLYLTGTNTSVALDKFYLTVFDSDSSETAVEHITFYNRVTNVYYVPEHDMNITGKLNSIGLTFSSTLHGQGEDNPKDPMNLTDLQKRRAVMVSYEAKTQWRYTFAVTGGKSGRNFAFGGKSNLPLGVTTTTTTRPTKTTTQVPGGKDNTGAPTPAPTVEPTVAPTAAPTVAPTAAPTSEPTAGAPTAQPTAAPTDCDEVQSCQIWADPHVSGFDNSENQGPDYFKLLRTSGADAKEDTRSNFGMHTFDGRPVDVDAYDSGDFWLVKSEPVHIQARFRRSGEFIPDHAAVGALAVGGPFLKGRTLMVEALDGQVSFDGMPMPRGTWRDVGGEVTVRRVENDVEAVLPMGVKLFLKRFDKHIDVQITMPKIEGGVDGECGNYDGIAENDEETYVEERMGDMRIEDSVLLLPRDASSDALPKNGVTFTEEDYQAIAALRSDLAMAQFVKHVLAAEGKYVVPEEESELSGLVPWFSGTIATQNLQALKAELFGKSWVRNYGETYQN